MVTSGNILQSPVARCKGALQSLCLMARNLEKDAGSEARLIRIAESACQKETCAIQYCLQGILIYLAVSFNCEINAIVYFSKLSAPVVGVPVLPNVICLSVCLYF